jgi:endonuclease III
MNEKANKDFEKIDNELKILIKEIISATKKDEFNNTNEPMFLESIEKWKAYRVSM